ncbi:MAG: TolC family protein [Bacteroides sp.]|nr:TolC family protein [Bacteroides sp.]MCM1379815.1 TolC family protein [Bacteroides sp.]MCM1446174.1 TolC family protein [Prevotella sp.]
MLKKYLLAFSFSLLCLFGVNAEVMDLDRCISYAIEHNLTVKQSDLERRNAELEVVSAKDAVLPQISGSASQSWNFGRGLTASNTYADRNTVNFGAQLGLQLPLFNGLQTVRNIEYTKANLTAIVENLEATKDDVTLRVIAQYLQVLYCREIESVANSQVELTQEELERREALLLAGKIPEADMLDARSQAAQARLQLVTAQNDRATALLDLAQLLRVPNVNDFDIVALDSSTIPIIRDPQMVYDTALGINHTIRANEWQQVAASKRVKVAQTGYIPKLSFNAGLGSNYYKISGYENESFGQQFRHNFSQYVGFSLNVPIFDGLSTRNQVRSARIQQLYAELNLETQKDNLFKAINESYLQAVGAREKLAAAEEACTAGAAALAAVQEKYNLGRATPTEFDTAKNTLIQSMSQRAQARYELILRTRILDFYAE